MSGRRIVQLKLLATSAVTAKVGQRIRPTVAGQKEPMPYILLHKPGQENRQLLEGDADYPRSRIRIECVAASAAEADLIGDAVSIALKNVIEEVIEDGESPPVFRARASIMLTDLDFDGYSDAREGFTRILDVYVDWRVIS